MVGEAGEPARAGGDMLKVEEVRASFSVVKLKSARSPGRSATVNSPLSRLGDRVEHEQP